MGSRWNVFHQPKLLSIYYIDNIECQNAPDSQHKFLKLWLRALLHPLRLVQLDVELEEECVAQEGHLPVVAVEALTRRPRQVRSEALGCNSIDILKQFVNG